MTEQNDSSVLSAAPMLRRVTPRLFPDPIRSSLPPVADIVRLLVTRERLEQAADVIIELLDHLDGDPDDEPSLGSIGNTAVCLSLDQRRWAFGSSTDAEEDADAV